MNSQKKLFRALLSVLCISFLSCQSREPDRKIFAAGEDDFNFLLNLLHPGQGPHFSSQVEKATAAFLRLTISDRDRLFTEVNAKFSQHHGTDFSALPNEALFADPNLHFIKEYRTLRFQLPDASFWRQSVEACSVSGTAENYAKIFRASFQKLPQPEQESLLEFAASQYPKAKKKLLNSDALGPKRCLMALLLTHISFGHNNSMEKLAELPPEKVRKLHRNYFERVKQKVLEGNGLNGYSHTEFETVLRALQSYLKKHTPEYEGAAVQAILVGGSLPIGAARRKTSDLDLLFLDSEDEVIEVGLLPDLPSDWSNEQIEQQYLVIDAAVLRGYLEEQEVDELTPGSALPSLIAKSLRLSHPPKVSVNNIAITYFAEPNPLAFRVRPDSIEILLYGLSANESTTQNAEVPPLKLKYFGP